MCFGFSRAAVTVELGHYLESGVTCIVGSIVCVCVCVCLCVCVRACVRACVRVCVYSRDRMLIHSSDHEGVEYRYAAGTQR